MVVFHAVEYKLIVYQILKRCFRWQLIFQSLMDQERNMSGTCLDHLSLIAKDIDIVLLYPNGHG